MDDSEEKYCRLRYIICTAKDQRLDYYKSEEQWISYLMYGYFFLLIKPHSLILFGISLLIPEGKKNPFEHDLDGDE